MGGQGARGCEGWRTDPWVVGGRGADLAGQLAEPGPVVGQDATARDCPVAEKSVKGAKPYRTIIHQENVSAYKCQARI